MVGSVKLHLLLNPTVNSLIEPVHQVRTEGGALTGVNQVTFVPETAPVAESGVEQQTELDQTLQDQLILIAQVIVTAKDSAHQILEIDEGDLFLEILPFFRPLEFKNKFSSRKPSIVKKE
jgi:hypothetical protein